MYVCIAGGMSLLIHRTNNESKYQLEGAQRVHISAKWIIGGHVTLATSHTVPWKVHVKSEVRTFNGVRAIALNTLRDNLTPATPHFEHF